ncbi:MAG: hypothetical protein WCP86_04615, partial [bacterium]
PLAVRISWTLGTFCVSITKLSVIRVSPQVLDKTIRFCNIYERHEGKHGLCYIRVTFQSPRAGKALLRYGADGPVKVWINGSVVHSVNGTRGYQPGSDVVKTGLKEGWNQVMMKVTQGEGDWVASLRVLAEDGKSMAGLMTKTE